MVVFPGEEDCIFSCLCTGSEGSDSGNVTLISSMLLKSYTILVSQGNGCSPSGSREDGVMQQPVFLFVFWIYFCINQRVSIKGYQFSAFSKRPVAHMGAGIQEDLLVCCHFFDTEGRIL